MKTNGKSKALLVTTAHRGVFFGYGDGKPPKEGRVKLTNARLCVYWSADVKGFMGLAANGPTKGCRIGPPVPSITLEAVTSIAEVTKAAAEAWESASWSS